MDNNKVLETLRNAYANGYRYFGVRVVPEEVEVGQRLAPSYDWDMENDCSSDTQLSGTCAVFFDVDYIDWNDDDYNSEIINSLESAIAQSENYDGAQTVIIASKTHYENGWDENEIILEDADVVEVIA